MLRLRAKRTVSMSDQDELMITPTSKKENTWNFVPILLAQILLALFVPFQMAQIPLRQMAIPFL